MQTPDSFSVSSNSFVPSSSFVPAPGSPPPIAAPFTDNQSAYSKDIAAGNALTIMGFSRAVISAKNQFMDASWEAQQFNANARNEMYLAAITELSVLLVIFDQLSEVTRSYAEAYTANSNGINTVNGTLNTYNGGVNTDNAQITALNNAINSYNSGPGPGHPTQSELQTIINNYNAYATGRNTIAGQTNTAISSYNEDLIARNADLQAQYEVLLESGVSAATIAQLPLPAPYTGTAQGMPIAGNAPASPPMATISFTPHTALPLLTNTMNPDVEAGSGAELATALFAPFFDLMNGQFAITTDLLESQSEFNDLVQFVFNDVPYLPDTFYTPSPDLKMSSGVGGTGTGVSLATIITSLSNPLMETIISTGIATANYALFNQPNTPQVVNQLTYLGLHLLSKVGLQAGSPALRLLEGRLPFIDPRSSPVSAIVGYYYASELSAAIASGAVPAGVKEILSKAYPELDATSLNDLTTKLSAGVELVLLQTGLAQLGQALGTPDLFGQVLSTVPNKQVLGLSSQPSSTDILKNSVLRKNITRDVINAATISEDILNHAINDAVADGDYNQGTFINTLVANKVAEKEATNAAIIMRSYLNSEIIGNGILDKTVVINPLNSSILANEAVKKIVSNQPDITNRQLRDELVNQFVANGATQQEAIATATLAVTGRSELNLPLSSLSDILYDKGLSLIAGLGLSPSKSQAFANDLVNTVLSPNIPGSQTSIRDMVDSRLAILIKGENAKTVEKITENFQASQDQVVNFYVLAENLRVHANTFIGIMYDKPKPSNYSDGAAFLV